MKGRKVLLLCIACHLVVLCNSDNNTKSLDISFGHEEVFGVRGSETFEDYPTVVDEVKFSKLQWEDDAGNEGAFNFKNPQWAEEYKKNSKFVGEYFVDDAQDFINTHHNEDWYDDNLSYEDESIPWFKGGVEMKRINSMSDKDYYDFLMQEFQKQQHDYEEPLFPAYTDTRLKKSAEKPKAARPRDDKLSEPCTLTTLRLCNVFFAIPLIAVIILIIVGVYFIILFCYIKNPGKACTGCCPCLYRHGDKYIPTEWADSLTIRAGRSKKSVESERIIIV